MHYYARMITGVDHYGIENIQWIFHVSETKLGQIFSNTNSLGFVIKTDLWMDDLFHEFWAKKQSGNDDQTQKTLSPPQNIFHIL